MTRRKRRRTKGRAAVPAGPDKQLRVRSIRRKPLDADRLAQALILAAGQQVDAERVKDSPGDTLVPIDKQLAVDRIYSEILEDFGKNRR